MLDDPLDPGELIAAPTADDALTLMDQLVRWLATSGVKIVIIMLAATLLSVAAGRVLRRFFRTMVQSGAKISTVTGTVIRRGPTSTRAATARRRSGPHSPAVSSGPAPCPTSRGTSRT